MIGRMLALLALFALLGAVAAPAEDVRRHAQGTPDAGLPATATAWAPYHADPEHALNRVFRRLFLAEAVPAVVGSALPREAAPGPLAEGWMLAWRDGTPADRRLFGGDGRQLVREGFDAAEAAALRADLAAITDADVAALKAQPALAVLFQHDLLRLVQRLDDTGESKELVPVLLAAARRVALPREALLALPDPLAAEGALPESPAARAYLARGDVFQELLRRSTRLFDASRSLLWSRLHLAHPDGAEALGALVTAARGGAAVEVPVGLRGLLVQGVVALDTEGAPVATPVVVDVRLQTLVNRAGLAADNPTTSRDGVDFAMLQLEREAVRLAPSRPVLRVVHDDDQDLFRDYGTLKHTTYRAQCALCHRTTRTPEPHLGGFPVLRPHAEPTLASTGDERLRLAEDQVRAWLAGLE